MIPARRAPAIARLAPWTRAALIVALAGVGCTGTRGAILLEVDAAPPIADASPAVDAGCATCALPVTFVDAAPTPLHGGSTGTASTDACPANQVLVGVQGALSEPDAGILIVGSVQAICGEVVAGGAANDALHTRQGSTLPPRGLGGGAAWSALCPADTIVVGVSGNAGAALDRIALACARWTVTRTSSGATVASDAPSTLPAAGGDGGAAFDQACPPGQMARGIVTRSGDWVDALGLLCGAPVP